MPVGAFDTKKALKDVASSYSLTVVKSKEIVDPRKKRFSAFMSEVVEIVNWLHNKDKTICPNKKEIPQKDLKYFSF